jgi:two-component system, NtrC family, sensor kinase
MLTMRIGTRLTAGLLLALTPLVASFSYWHVQRSTLAYIGDLKRAIRATADGMAPALADDLAKGEKDQVADVLRQVGIDGTTSAVFMNDGRLQTAAPGFPQDLMPDEAEFRRSRLYGAVEFEHRTLDSHWFGRLEVLAKNGRNHGYLLVAQDWSNINDDLRGRTTGSAVAGLLVILATSTIVPLMVRRYVSGPLAELSQKVMGFSRDDAEPLPQGDELLMLTEEFRRLDQQLTRARDDLVGKHQRELELERKLERAGRLATIGTLASGLAHEIGTPLGVIRGRAEFLLESTPVSAKTEDGLRIIVNQIDRISRIVRMLLDYARERTRQRIFCDARTLVEQALNLMETEASARKIHVISELGDRSLMIECDPYQMHQVLINLIVNALDAMNGREDGILKIAARRVLENDREVAMLTFADNGSGIAIEDQPRVFDPFFSTKEPGKGTGMGLAVTQSIVRDHRGEVSFDTDPSGTRFIVSIPISVDGTGTASEARRTGEERAA